MNVENSMLPNLMQQTILVIDDTPVNLQVITDTLKDQGYKVSVATTGAVGLERAKRILPDLILLDVMIPDIDGFKVCRRLKSDAATRSIPIIFMTVLESVQLKVRAFQEGAVDYVTKPIHHEELLARVTTHLQMQALMRHFQIKVEELDRARMEIELLNERLKAENLRVSTDLQTSERKYRTLVEKMRDGYVVLRNGDIVFANEAFCRMHGYRLDEVAGQVFEQFVAPESWPEVSAWCDQRRRPPADIHFLKYTGLAKGGRQLAIEMTTNLTDYENTTVIIGICRDLTQRMALEQKMRETERMADIGKITTSLSHDLRNPLSAIKMNLQLLQRYHQIQSTGENYLGLSINEVNRLERVLQELLDFAKPPRLTFSKCQMNRILADCLDLLAIKFDQHGLTVIPSFDPNIPEMQADQEKLVQVFMNLLLNALEASTQGGRIWVSSQYCEQVQIPGIEIRIEDEGPGISETLVSEIFKPFFTTKAQGTGLGLTNVKHLVSAHEGVVEVFNRQPHGAIVRVYFPL